MTYSGQPDQRKTRSNVFILVRAFTYATLLVGLGLLVLPPDALSGLGVTRPTAIHITQVGGIAVGVGGGAI